MKKRLKIGQLPTSQTALIQVKGKAIPLMRMDIKLSAPNGLHFYFI